MATSDLLAAGTKLGAFEIDGFIARGGISTAGAHSHTVTGGGDNESRPPNAYVNYIIKL